MKSKQPPFEITSKMLGDVAEISELVGRFFAHDHLSGNPNLRRTNRIRTIYGSLAIEQNTLSLEQVTAVFKRQTRSGAAQGYRRGQKRV